MTTAIHQAVAAYAHALDEPGSPGLEALLTEDTTWTFTAPGPKVLGPITGRTEVLDFVRAGQAAQAGRVRHHLTNVAVISTGVAQAYLLQTDENRQILATGVYTFSLRETDGEWQIAELTLSFDKGSQV